MRGLRKNYGSFEAVKGIDFFVRAGEVFGLLGPNGAGKTTSIRIMLDIFKPDQGSVTILGGPMTESTKDRIGYMPEERGMYQDIPLDRCLVYLATLKGLTPDLALQRINTYLERFDLYTSRHKKVKELSKGMQQKAQLITTLVHEPELVIIDEPFSGLDPINTQMVKDLLREQRDRGATILMSTHQMHQVEELCDRIVAGEDGSYLEAPLRKRLGQGPVEEFLVFNQELVALGAANVASGLFQGFSVSSSSSRTPVAETAGAKAVNGLGMLLWQGVFAFEHWTGRTPPADVMQAALFKGF